MGKHPWVRSNQTKREEEGWLQGRRLLLSCYLLTEASLSVGAPHKRLGPPWEPEGNPRRAGSQKRLRKGWGGAGVAGWRGPGHLHGQKEGQEEALPGWSAGSGGEGRAGAEAGLGEEGDSGVRTGSHLQGAGDGRKEGRGSWSRGQG